MKGDTDYRLNSDRRPRRGGRHAGRRARRRGASSPGRRRTVRPAIRPAGADFGRADQGPDNGPSDTMAEESRSGAARICGNQAAGRCNQRRPPPAIPSEDAYMARLFTCGCKSSYAGGRDSSSSRSSQNIRTIKPRQLRPESAWSRSYLDDGQLMRRLPRRSYTSYKEVSTRRAGAGQPLLSRRDAVPSSRRMHAGLSGVSANSSDVYGATANDTLEGAGGARAAIGCQVWRITIAAGPADSDLIARFEQDLADFLIRAGLPCRRPESA